MQINKISIALAQQKEIAANEITELLFHWLVGWLILKIYIYIKVVPRSTCTVSYDHKTVYRLLQFVLCLFYVSATFEIFRCAVLFLNISIVQQDLHQTIIAH